jgi:hypothetical protein
MQHWNQVSSANGVQRAIFDGCRVTFTLARNGDDGCGDDFSYWGISIQAKIEQGSLIRRRHRFNFCRSEGPVGNQSIDGQARQDKKHERMVVDFGGDLAIVKAESRNKKPQPELVGYVCRGAGG